MDRDFDFESVDYNPFGEKEIVKVAPLTDAQKEIWLSCILGGDDANLSYNESVSLEFSGGLNKKDLWEACEYLVERHESLRMSFSADGNFFMVYNHLKPFKIQKDFSIFTERDKKTAVEEFLDQEASFVFDIKNGPLVRFSLIELSHESFLFTITAHHMVADGWSFGVMLEEVASIYNALKSNKSINLPDAVQFGQYAEEMELFSDSPEYQSTEKYWLENYKLIPEQLELPTDRPRPVQRTFQSRRIDFELPAELVKRIKELGKKSKSSLVSTIMAAFEIFLSKITGQDDIVLGLPAAGQAATDHLVLVGHCVNLLPIRTKVDHHLSFEEYLGKRRLELLDDYDHEKYTFGNLIKKLNIKRDTSRIPLVPVVFNIDMGMDDLVNFSGLQHSLISNPRKFENFEIFLNLANQGEKLVVEWSYNTDLFHEKTIFYWMQGLEDLLSHVVLHPNKPIKNLIFNESLVFQQLREWNATSMEFPVQNSFLEIFWEQAKSTPLKIAYQAVEKEFTFENLRLYSNAIAKKLRNQGLGKGDVVGLMLDRNEMLLPALLGIMESGACYLPLDPNFPLERLRYMLEDSGASLLVTERKYGSWLGIDLAQLTLDDLSSQEDDQFQEIEIPEPNDLAYILYTSGSTGKPKGVKITHLNLLNFLVSMRNTPGMLPGEKLLAITTISFDIAGLELYLPLIAGGTVVLANSEECRDGRMLLRKMESQKIDIMQATPATWRMLIASGWVKPMDLKVLCGGEALNQDIAEKLLKLVGPFWNMYGPTETTIWSTVKRIENADQITIGRPIANTQIYILDENLKPCPVGRVGEICIGGLGVTGGYHKRNDLAKDKFLLYPFSDEENARLYRTGDLGKFLLNGEIVCLGRLDFQVKIRGYRIELGEIESVLNKIPGVKEAVVLAREDVEESGKKLVAYVVSDSSNASLDRNQKIQFFRGKVSDVLPDYMLPQDWVFMDSFPLTSNNKTDRNKLPSPEIEEQIISDDFQPKSKNERMVAEIWSKFLKKNNFKINDDFFEMGGHSLTAVDVVADVEKKLKKEISINTIFKYRTLGLFAGYLDSKEDKNEDWSCLVPIKPTGTKFPLYIIHGVGCSVTSYYALGERMPDDRPLYGFQVKGLNGIDEPHHSLEEMAGHYLDLMLEHNTNGPYYISGYSFGGYVAYEMARQMLSKGILNFKLILFDTAAEYDFRNISLYKKIKLELGKRLVESRLFFNYPGYFIKSKQKAAQVKLEKKLRLKVLHEEFVSDRREIIKRLSNNNVRVLMRYKMEPIPANIYLFKVKVPNFYVSDMVNYGWMEFVNQVNIVPISGHHNIIFKDNEVLKEVVGKIQIILE